ncbi:MAG TPA: 3' terminal RNA ribose 2'-O-methyltransferase Hen1 [Microlunatus sp.]|nr:3' terminal RNA ribose 2'-O-methyltransferase Hen1 [Microlunatus sp.]
MIITLSTGPNEAASTTWPASDLGFLLHKHPDRLQSFDLSVGTAYVCYPEATAERCTVALLLEVDPVGLVRGQRRGGSEVFSLGQYVNDRPYAASSLLSTALTKVFRTAMTGRCDARPDLAAAPLKLEISIPTLPCRGGADLAHRVFEPLGWRVAVTPIPLDPTIPSWGASRYLSVRLSGTVRLSDALNHLYVLLPVLDDAKHYWVTTDEVDKLIRAGEGWLATHPDKTLITERYLRHRGTLTRDALARLAEVDDLEPERLDDSGESADVRSASLAEQRRAAVLAAVRAAGAKRVGDLGCGEGALLADLLAERTIEQVIAADVSARSLDLAARRIGLDRMNERQQARINLLQSSLTYTDQRLVGLDAVILMEVVEHLDLSRLPALERSVFGVAAPGVVIVTTPNADYNVRYDDLPVGAFRHRDHRFEWSRAEFAAWAERVAMTHGYEVRLAPIWPVDERVGSLTQLAIFDRAWSGRQDD